VKKHELKTWPEQYAALRDGSKKFELREDDRGFQVGDLLILREWVPETATYSGSLTAQFVTYILRGPAFGLPAGKVIMSLSDERPRS
jgi:hypothetical protein